MPPQRPRRHRGTVAAALALCVAALSTPASDPAAAETKLRVFVGGQQRPDVMRPLLERYEKQNPGTTVELEVGGATSELQQQYLTTVLTAKDSAIDLMLIDVVRPAQYAAAGWAEPLDQHLGEGGKDAALGRFLPVYRDADQVGGKLVALPAFADAMFLYYRKDLLEKHGVEVPTTWEGLVQAAKKVLAAENDPSLQGVSFQGKAIEGAVCTFLVPYWSAGAKLTDENGRLAFDRAAAERSLSLWKRMVEEGVAKRNIAEVGTDDTRKEFQAGNAVFAVLWAYGWNHFQGAESKVGGKVGVAPLPSFEGGKPATCIGGWQWAVSAFGENKKEAVELARFLSGPEGSEHLAVNASNLPVVGELYAAPDVLKANPWFADAKPVVETARARPKTPRYQEVSETIRNNVNAVLAGVKPVPEAVSDMEARLGRILR